MTGEVQRVKHQKQHSNWLRNWILTRLNWLSNEWLDGYNVVTHEKLSPGQLGDLSIGNIALKTNGTKYRYEAEDAVYESPIAVRVNRPETNASNDSYLGDISQNIGKTITFKVTATQRKQCYLVAAVAAKGSDIPFSDMFIITVNHPLNHRNIVILAFLTTWHDWVEVDIFFRWRQEKIQLFLLLVVLAQTLTMIYIQRHLNSKISNKYNDILIRMLYLHSILMCL